MSDAIASHTIVLDDWSLSNLTESEVSRLTQNNGNNNSDLIAAHFRRCCLGILGAAKGMHSTENLPQLYPHFSVAVKRRGNGIALEIRDMPMTNTVDGVIIEAKRDQLIAATRDVLLFSDSHAESYTLDTRTDQVKKMLKAADMLQPTEHRMPNGTIAQLPRVITWGGHTVGHDEYTFCKDSSEQLGLRYYETGTGGGPGNMKASLKGNHIGLIQQKVYNARQYGITALEIVESEPPNKYASSLSIMPNIEMRLEAFLRLMNAAIIFPGGVGTAEEFLMMLAIKMHENNKDQIIPVILTAPESSRPYVRALEAFVEDTLGPEAQQYYTIVLGSPTEVAQETNHQIRKDHRVQKAREHHNDSMVWNGSLYLPPDTQEVFIPTHENVSRLHLSKQLEPYVLASRLRKIFKAIVWGSIIPEGRQMIADKGSYEIRADATIAKALERLLTQFVDQKRMRVEAYVPCYNLISTNSSLGDPVI